MHMISKYTLVLLFVGLTFSSACDDQPIIEPAEVGSLQFGFRMAGQEGFKQKKAEKCELIDIGNQMQYFGIGTKRLVDQADVSNYDWTELFSYQEPLDKAISYYTERQDIKLDVPFGRYVANKHVQSTDVVWVLKTPSNDTIKAIVPNTTNCPQDVDARGFFTEYADSTGMFTEKDGTMQRCRSGGSEGLGEFEIKEGFTTQVIMRMNISHITWVDTDKNGKWSEGDSLKDFETYDGLPLMMRYEVKYVED